LRGSEDSWIISSLKKFGSHLSREEMDKYGTYIAGLKVFEFLMDTW